MPPVLRSGHRSSGAFASDSNFDVVAEAPRSREPASRVSSSGPILVMPGDVLLGRGKGAYEWGGNIEYQKIIASYLPSYVRLTENKDKIEATQNIVQQIKKRGNRFLRGDSPADVLYEVSDNEARIKVSQALRHQRRLLGISCPQTNPKKKKKTAGKQPVRSKKIPTRHSSRAKYTTRAKLQPQPPRKVSPSPPPKSLLPVVSCRNVGEVVSRQVSETEEEAAPPLFDIPAIFYEDVPKDSDDVSEFSLIEMDGLDGVGELAEL